MTTSSEKDMPEAHVKASTKPLMADKCPAPLGKAEKPARAKKENYLLSWIRTEIKTFNMHHVYLAAKSLSSPNHSDSL